MPPKTTPKTTPKAEAKKAPTRKAPSLELTPSPAPKSPPPLKFSPYPDLTMAITMLRAHQRSASAHKSQLLDKWLVMLNKVQTEMTALRNLEKLTSTVRSTTQAQTK